MWGIAFDVYNQWNVEVCKSKEQQHSVKVHQMQSKKEDNSKSLLVAELVSVKFTQKNYSSEEKLH